MLNLEKPLETFVMLSYLNYFRFVHCKKMKVIKFCLYTGFAMGIS